MNPYERRRGPRRPGEAPAGMHSGGFVSAPRESPLALEDLEALVESATNRQVRRWHEGLERQKRDEIRDHRRVAWEEGHTAGVQEGEQLLLNAIEAQWLARVETMIREIAALVEGVEAGLMASQLRQAAELLEQLKAAHHRGFAEDLPF